MALKGKWKDKVNGVDLNSADDINQVAHAVIELEERGAGGIMQESDPTVPSWAKQQNKPKYTASEVGALPSTTKIPTKTSDLTNDSNFVTKAVSDLANYYLKSQTYTKDEVNALVSAIPKFGISVVSSLPASNISETTIYLVGGGSGNDLYTEYIYTNGKWEILGSQKVDLTGYAKEAWVNTQLSSYLKSSELDAAIEEALNEAKESGEFEGQRGEDGVSVTSVEQTTTSTADGGTNVITVTLSNGQKFTFTIKNGTKGSQGVQGEKGNDGTSITITNIDQTSASGGVNVITFSDGTNLLVRNGYKGDKGDTGTTGATGATGKDGRGIKSIARTSGNGSAGTTDTYTITFTDNTTSTFTVYNGKNGTNGKDGKDYVLTTADKNDIADNIAVGLTLGVHTDGLIYIFKDGEPVGNGVEMGVSGDISGYVDSENNLILKENREGALPDGIYTAYVVMEDGSKVAIGELTKDTNVYYTVKNTLTNCKNSNSATQVVEGNSYSATITANDGYELKTVTVTMGGSNVSVSGGNINIASVTGNIVITAVAEEAAVVPTYTNLLLSAIDADGTPYNNGKGYIEGYRLSGSSSTGVSALANCCASGYMPISSIEDTIRIKNITPQTEATANRLTFYDASKTKIYEVTQFHLSDYVTVNDGVYTTEPKYWAAGAVAYFRFSAGVISEDTIVTVNEEIV